MTKLHRYYIIPIEFYSFYRRNQVEETLRKILRPDNGLSFPSFLQLAENLPAIYLFSEEWPTGHLLFDGTGCCLVFSEIDENWVITQENIEDELQKRSVRHNKLIGVKEHGWLQILFNQSFDLVDNREFPSPKIEYVFGFYIVENDGDYSEDQRNILKMLVEPSILGIDDMFPIDIKQKHVGDVQSKEKFFDEIVDVDISANSELYVTWATLVSITTSAVEVMRNADLLVTLETRLQLIWNRCYVTGNFINLIFSGQFRVGDISNFYWMFLKSLSDARSVLSSIQSSRSMKIFQQLCQTSRIHDEVERVADKLNLLEKFLAQKREKAASKYRRIIEFLLFLLAISQIFPIFFQMPLTYNPVYGEIIVMVTLVIGLIAISRR